MNKTKLKIGFFASSMLLVILFTGTKQSFISLIAAVIHEFGHIVAAKILGIHLCEFNLSLIGARLKIKGNFYSYKKEIILCFFGPLFNFLSAIIFFMLRSINIDFFDILLTSSLALGTLNLLPIKTFDGGRILEAFLLSHFSPYIAKYITEFLSFITLFSLWCISVYILLIYKSSLGLFVFSASVFCQHFIPQND